MNEPKNVLITGASGLIGTRLTALLQAKGFAVSHLSRSKSDKIKTFLWDIPNQTIENGALNGVDIIIHLAGAGVADKRWTKERKKEIIDSRVQSTQLLFDQLKNNSHNVKTFISASGVGYYGFKNPEKVFTETSPPGDDFLANVTFQWEREVDKISDLGIRVIKMRTGIVLAKDGGALKPMANTVKNLVGSPLGTGKQYMSWIHIDDLCEMYIMAAENNQLNGAINAVTPTPVTNEGLIKAIAKTLHKPLIAPAVPAFALKLVLGEMAEIVLEGSKVSPEKIVQAGFNYKFKNLQRALSDLLE